MSLHQAASMSNWDPEAPEKSSESRFAQGIAISQHEANLVQGCGYKDNRWNVNYRYHYDWCIGTPSDTTRQETGARQAMLDRCKP